MKKMWKQLTALTLLLSFALGFSGCGEHEFQADDLMKGVTTQTIEVTEVPQTFEQSQMAFALELFQKTVKASEEENVLLSPLSVMLALSMTANGADGETKAQMEEVLGLPIEELNAYLYSYVKTITGNEFYKLNISNSIWFRSNGIAVKTEFLQTNADYYGADVFGAKFNQDTVKDMNKWVSDKTNGLIQNMVEKIESDELMYLINTVLFDAKWLKAYNSDQISEKTFYPLTGAGHKVTSMFSKERRYIEDDKATGFIKPFVGEQYSMAILLPNEGVNVKDYVAQLTADGIQKTLSNITQVTVYTRLPKFSYDFSANMNDVLKDMGIQNAFANSADFSKMGEVTGMDGDSLYIGNVVHKTRIQVDELGTVAGASTSVSIQTDGIEMEKRSVYVDRPFVYMIIDNQTNLPLFMGMVTDINR